MKSLNSSVLLAEKIVVIVCCIVEVDERVYVYDCRLNEE
jgi:hypothetical protein